MKRHLGLLSIVLLTSGCAVGPKYKRPVVAVPNSYRGEAPKPAAQSQIASPQPTSPQSVSLGDQKWWDVFQDEQLRTLIRTALQQNYDVRIAASRILEGQAQLGITRADQFPTLSTGAGLADARTAQAKFFPTVESGT